MDHSLALVHALAAVEVGEATACARVRQRHTAVVHVLEHVLGRSTPLATKRHGVFYGNARLAADLARVQLGQVDLLYFPFGRAMVKTLADVVE